MTALRQSDDPGGASVDPIEWLRLIRSRRVGAVTFHRLLAEHGNVAAALTALPGIAHQAGVTGYEICPLGVIKAEIAAGRKAGARLITFADPAYPQALRDLPDAPPVLWVKGDLSTLARPSVAIVGARNASSLGLRMARHLATGLADAGLVIVSGLARGIDTEAHRTALTAGTIAVMAGGVDVAYPPENAKLMADITAQGCLISEQPPGYEPQARHFPQRNRIISGLSMAVVVVEAADRSGSLLTARDALDQGRDVLVVPGHPLDQRAAGCNQLLRDGATLIRNAEDILTALQNTHERPIARPADQKKTTLRQVPADHVAIAQPQPAPRSKAEMRNLHAQILARIGPSPLAEDQLIRDLGVGTAQVMTAVLELELDGLVERQPGAMISKLH